MGSVLAFDPLQVSVNVIANRLVRVFGYSAEEAEYLAPQIRWMREPVRASFQRLWLTARCDPDVAVEEISIRDLVTRARLHPVAAFLALDDLQKNPHNARALIARLCSPPSPSPRQLDLGDFHATYRVLT